MKPPSKLKWIATGDGYLYEKQLEGGGTIRRNCEAEIRFLAFDRNGNYLGFAGDQASAAVMATSGRVNVIHGDPANALCLWTMWNEAVHTDKTTVYGDDEGNQFIYLGLDVFLRAAEDATGWDVELLADTEMKDRYWDTATNTFSLHVVNYNKHQME